LKVLIIGDDERGRIRGSVAWQREARREGRDGKLGALMDVPEIDSVGREKGPGNESPRWGKGEILFKSPERYSRIISTGGRFIKALYY
jgi:hypothetical protein